MLPRTSKREYRKDFTGSDFFLFYNRLIHDERLLAAMRAHGYTGKFYLHPVFESQMKDFKSSDVISVGASVADYQEIFKESDLLVTDFSSVAFDFAYLKKPLVYAQYDFDQFYEKHSWDKGYFSYPENGFGPVLYAYDAVVDAIISYVETGCIMEELYKKRVDDFFAFTDRNNCERVYRAIETLHTGGANDETGL
jgi:CDP-glycerol glycerophosphotransferase (TagB/SpsB family)